jgi:hypothetical protein
VGIYILLRYSPFPRIFRWLLPFTFFLQYQYAVVARPYVLFPALLFSLCILFTAERPRPVWFALVAGLLVNISLHAAILAGVLSLLYLHELYGRRHSEGRAAPRAIAAATVAFVLLCACSAVVAFPAPDTAVALAPEKRVIRKPIAFLAKMMPEEKMATAPIPAEVLDPDLQNHVTSDFPEIVRQTVVTIILSANGALYPIAKSNLLASCFVGCFWLWLWSRGCGRLMLPYLLSVLLTSRIFIYDQHTGIFLFALVAAAWIALNTPIRGRGSRWIEPAFVTLAMAIVVLQIGWSVHCVRSVARAPTDPGRETESFLATNFAGKRIAGFGFETVSTQAYADHNLFFNWPHAYWVWSMNVLTDNRRGEALAAHPDAVVFREFNFREENALSQWFSITPKHPGHFAIQRFWQQNGYQITHRFCGDQFRRMGVSATVCEVIMEPAANDPANRVVREK